jgi:hypothetical protein
MAAVAEIDWDGLRRWADTLPEQRRARVRDEWARAAQVEHASIASFDRFSLQLLAVGAPPSLIEAAHRAAIDEVRHAQLSFAVASIYAAQSLGPGPLLLTPSAFADFSPSFVVRSAVEEGCVGETLAAAEAQAACDRAQPGALRQVLTAIADDEAEHAALAYRFAAWALGALGADARRAIEAGFGAALAQISAEPSSGVEAVSPQDAWLESHGRLCSHTRAEQRAKALAEVVLPARRDLLGT